MVTNRMYDYVLTRPSSSLTFSSKYIARTSLKLVCKLISSYGAQQQMNDTEIHLIEDNLFRLNF